MIRLLLKTLMASCNRTQAYTCSSKSHIFVGFVGFEELIKHSSIATIVFVYNNRKKISRTEAGPDLLMFRNPKIRNVDFIEPKLGSTETFPT